MTAEDMTMQALRKEVSELTLRLKELGDENRDLCEICNENGIQLAVGETAQVTQAYDLGVIKKFGSETSTK